MAIFDKISRKIAARRGKGVMKHAPSPIENLPVEIWYHILERLVGTDPIFDTHAHFFGRIPPSLCLVNKRWNGFFTPILYYRFDFDGYPPQIPSLWQFLRTIVSRPDLAEHIREATFTTSRLYDPYQSPPNNGAQVILLKLYTDNKAILKQAARQARFDTIKSAGKPLTKHLKPALYESVGGQKNNKCIYANVQQRFQDGYQNPLMALILAHLPNLTRLSMHFWNDDRFFGWVNRIAGSVAAKSHKGSGIAFQNLERLYICPRLSQDNRTHTTWIRDTVEIDSARPFHHLPKLTELMVLRERPNPAQIQHPTTIQQLTLPDLRNDLIATESLLRVSPKLRQLSLQLDNWCQAPGYETHRTLWPMLLRFKETLEYLDIAQPPHPTRPNTFDTSTLRPFCPSLAKFKKLRQLNLTPVLLIGLCTAHKAPTRMSTHLPPNLESLGLYAENSNWLTDHIDHLEAEFENLIATGGPNNNSNTLRSITFDYEGSLPLNKLRAAAGNAVTVRTDGANCLFYGGKQATFVQSCIMRDGVRGIVYSLRHRRPEEVIPRGMVVHGVRGALARSRVGMGTGDLNRLKRARMSEIDYDHDHDYQGAENVKRRG
ncbi:hypothetical protein BDW59DRAFT_166076 [Aspergillus cavernicola]|uniref:F-box domain-containing protein n=1 Tax=Aspergillus cavernicola TaxID=176166 RepID=A0ABR4HNI6_9EURO